MFFQNLRLKLSAFDCDRYSKTAEIGSTSLLLKEVKQLNTSEELISVSNFLALKKQVCLRHQKIIHNQAFCCLHTGIS